MIRSDDQAGRCVCGGPCHGLKEWSTSAELAEWLGLELQQLYWLRARKNGPRGHKIGSGILYRRVDVEAWLLTRAEDA
jgi:predicted DNA-binding transcriptional regulator AlpA